MPILHVKIMESASQMIIITSVTAVKPDFKVPIVQIKVKKIYFILCALYDWVLVCTNMNIYVRNMNIQIRNKNISTKLERIFAPPHRLQGNEK